MDRTACPAAQVLKRDKEDVDARYDRAMLYADVGESRKAMEGLEQVGGLESKQPRQAGRQAGTNGRPTVGRLCCTLPGAAVTTACCMCPSHAGASGAA